MFRRQDLEHIGFSLCRMFKVVSDADGRVRADGVAGLFLALFNGLQNLVVVVSGGI